VVRSSRTAYRCSECGFEAVKWVGRCPECQSWGSLQERAAAARPRGEVAKAVALMPSSPARPLDAVDVQSARAASTGVGEFDRVLGGGLVPGEVVLLAGEPGVGKSTLLLQVVHRWASEGGVALYVTG
jgi:DNA repair protein RadA/Sms